MTEKRATTERTLQQRTNTPLDLLIWRRSQKKEANIYLYADDISIYTITIISNVIVFFTKLSF